MPRHKPAAEGGYQRGEETRARIIEAAIVVFGERGYDSASTRDIAAAAGVNAPAIQYYFDSKEGVYLACVEQLIAMVWQQMGDTVEVAEAALADPAADDQRLIATVLGMLGAVISMIRDTPTTAVWREFLSRHQEGLCPESASTAFEMKFKARMHSVMRQLIARLTGLTVEDERTIIHTIALFTQGMAFRWQRSRMLTVMNWTGVNQREMELIRDVVLTQARFTLEGLARQRVADTSLGK